MSRRSPIMHLRALIFHRMNHVYPKASAHSRLRLLRMLHHLHDRFRLAAVAHPEDQGGWSAFLGREASGCFDEILPPPMAGTRSRSLAACLGIQPQECLLIGDRVDRDWEQARLAGMPTLLVQHRQDLFVLPKRVSPICAQRVTTRTRAQSDFAVASAARALGQGELVVVPTDTVYGLAAKPDADAIRWLYRAKGRAEDLPLVLLIANPRVIERFARLSLLSRTLIRRYWPGPLTLVLPLRPQTSWGRLTRGGRWVGVRVPNHPLCQRIIRAAGGVLAVTSANRSGKPAPVTARDVDQNVLAFSRVLVDAGRASGIPSTVVKVWSGRGEILRRGALIPTFHPWQP